MSKPETALLNTEDLKKRWKFKKLETIQKIARRYSQTLLPVKIGGTLFFKPENVLKFEDQQRIYDE